MTRTNADTAMTRRTSVSTRVRGLALAASLGLSLSVRGGAANAQVNTVPNELQGVGITEHLGAPIPRDVVLRDHTGNRVQLGQFFTNNRPVAFIFFYDRCPSLCSFVMNGMINSLRTTQWTAGERYDVVMLSIDPTDDARSLSAKRQRIMRQYRDAGRIVHEEGWHVLGGDTTAIRQVADAFGYRYRYDERQNQYAHPGALFLLTPDGRLARYLYGITYDPNAVRFGLLEASEGRSVNTIERVLLFCYHYDPQAGRYVLIARRVMSLGGVLTALVFGSFLSVLWLRERRKQRGRDAGQGTNDGAEGPGTLATKALQEPASAQARG